MSALPIRNVAIIAHVDHGKTTLVDKLLYQSGMFRSEDLDKLAGGQHGLILDSNDLERERGITIFSKNCSVRYLAKDGIEYWINLIDTPGHADFGGEVERVLSMADGALLLVDSFEGPMPQTRFVLSKALSRGLSPIVFVNKVDRIEGRPDRTVDAVFDLLVELEADDEALDFPIVFGSGRDGWATDDADEIESPDRPQDLRAIFEAIVQQVPPPRVDDDAPPRMRVTSIEYSEFVGRIALGKLESGTLRRGQDVVVMRRADGKRVNQRVLEVHLYRGLSRQSVDQVSSGQIVAIVGLDPIDIGDTIADPSWTEPLAAPPVDEPTLHMTFRINDGPFAGKEGEFVTSRQIKNRLDRELESDVALRVEPGDSAEEFHVSGRGLMHLGILLENMRREGFELCVGKPRVIFREIDGQTLEPIERLVVECPAECQGPVMGLIGDRRAELVEMGSPGEASDFVHLEFTIPARGLIGLRSRMLTATQGRAVMHHNFHGYERVRGAIPQRQSGVMISGNIGAATAYSLDALYDRGSFFVAPGDPVYEGQMIGEHCKDSDIIVNAVRNKKLTNVRASGKDDQTSIKPPRRLSLEAALEYIQDDEFVEITPKSIRLRKRLLGENDRKRASRRTSAV